MTARVDMLEVFASFSKSSAKFLRAQQWHDVCHYRHCECALHFYGRDTSLTVHERPKGGVLGNPTIAAVCPYQCLAILHESSRLQWRYNGIHVQTAARSYLNPSRMLSTCLCSMTMSALSPFLSQTNFLRLLNLQFVSQQSMTRARPQLFSSAFVLQLDHVSIIQQAQRFAIRQAHTQVRSIHAFTTSTTLL